MARYRRVLVAALLAASSALAAGGATLDSDATGAVWLAGARGLLKLDATRGELVLTVPDVLATRALAVDRSEGILWTYAGGDLRAFDLAGRALFATTVSSLAAVPPPFRASGGNGDGAATMVAAPSAVRTGPVAVADGGMVWIADGRRLVACDAAGREVWSSILGAPIEGLALDVVHGALWVATVGRVAAYGAGDGWERSELALGEQPQVVGIAADALRGGIWVAQAGNLQLYAADGTRRLNIAGDTAQPQRAVAADGSGGAWIAGGTWLAKVDATGRVGDLIEPFAGAPDGGRIGELAVDPRTGDLWVAGQTELAHVSAAGVVQLRMSFDPPFSILDMAFEAGALAAGGAGGGVKSAGGSAAPPAGLGASPAQSGGDRRRATGATSASPGGRLAQAMPRAAPGPASTHVIGTVVLPSGAPLAGATVNVLGQAGMSATTAADGSFSIANVAAAPGQTLTLTVVATAPGGQAVYAFQGVDAVAGGVTDANLAADTIFMALVICCVFFTLAMRRRISRRLGITKQLPLSP